jgi:hypothetical protein
MSKDYDKHSRTKQFIRQYCRNLKVDDVDWENASEPKRYNCMGFAVGVLKWWQPYERDRHGKKKNPYDYWPDGLPQDTTIESYVEAARSMGFVECGAGWEAGFEKIVLCFATGGEERLFTHAARQVSPDRWKSKFGKESDIEHPLEIGCAWHGEGRIYMRRPRVAELPGQIDSTAAFVVHQSA